MDSWASVLTLIVVGVILLIVELFLVPGTTFVGLLGFVLSILGIWYCYLYFGPFYGTLMLFSTFIVSGLLVWLGFRQNVWSRFALTDTNKSKVNDQGEKYVSAGDSGIAMSELRPSGNALINNKIFEVHTRGAFLSEGSLLKVISVENYKIVVVPDVIID